MLYTATLALFTTTTSTAKTTTTSNDLATSTQFGLSREALKANCGLAPLSYFSEPGLKLKQTVSPTLALAPALILKQELHQAAGLLRDPRNDG